jgi:hypothetical protein
MENSISIIRKVAIAAQKGFRFVVVDGTTYEVWNFVESTCNEAAAFNTWHLPTFYYDYNTMTITIEL